MIADTDRLSSEKRILIKKCTKLLRLLNFLAYSEFKTIYIRSCTRQCVVVICTPTFEKEVIIQFNEPRPQAPPTTFQPARFSHKRGMSRGMRQLKLTN